MNDQFDVTSLPSREALAAWLELEAALIEATPRGTEERKRLRVVCIASRPSDNEHVSSARRIARILRDPAVSLADVLARVRSAHHFRAVVRHTIDRLMGETSTPGSYRRAYLDSLPLHREGELDFEVERATDEKGQNRRSVRPSGPPVESVIDVSDPAWMIPGADELTEPVRTAEGTFEVPVSSILRPKEVAA